MMDRRERGDVVIDAYASALGDDADHLSDEELATDLIVDMLHALAASVPVEFVGRFDPQTILDLALMHFEEES